LHSHRGRLNRDGKDVKLLSRSGLDWTWRFPWITAQKLRKSRFVIDGEICVLGRANRLTIAPCTRAMRD
jgi:bifunctional non-homologous end joining protein LigD